MTLRRLPHLTALLLLAPMAVAWPSSPAAGQDLQRQIQDSRQRLDEIRAERERLQREMEGVRSRVRNVSEELRNIERQLSVSRSVLSEIEFQVDATTRRIEATTRELVQTRERLREGGAILDRRLRDIYKLGPLHSVRVLLGADSFTDLVHRYRYLRMMTAYDRTLVDGVAELETELEHQNDALQQSLAELDRLRQSQLAELAELRSVEEERQRTLEAFRSRERETMGRLDQLEADEERMTDLVADLDRQRREAERRRAVAGADAAPATLESSDAGTLDWPVEGDVLYRFGRERRPDGTVLRWNGVGIHAAPGTPVRAVRSGTVVMAGPFEGYGPTVVVSHGDGFYTLYLYLEEIGVVEGRPVEEGQVVGTVGGRDTPEGPHIEFQVRGPVAGGPPEAMDPLRWLKPRGS